ncbi:MAG: NADH-quinone oxidoreductase subunit NuoF [Armatimonadetes bacterium]|nr:NADH-quinone oxidoreductase subunit NuoF [Armatimonadota bacterium]
MPETRLLLKHSGDPEYRAIAGYMAEGGYVGLKKALTMERQAVIDEVKKSGLRGRGGAGFPTWMKWNSVPKEKTKPHYVLCNADEGEPGTFKDKELMENTPHLMIEGMIIGGYAIQAEVGYVYIRAEFMDCARAIKMAIDEAYENGFLGKNILGSGWDHDIYVHMGAGSYECGEENAMMRSLMGERGMPGLKFPHAPFPTIEGLWNLPTLINNVESFACVPHIVVNGGDWYAMIGASTKNSRGTKIFSVSGHVNKPGNYEIEFGMPLMELLELAGGMKGGELKACVPGGSSVPMINKEQCEKAIIGYEELVEVGTMVGSGGCIFLNEHTCIVTFIWRTTLFYARESCGKCTPCREGSGRLVAALARLRSGDDAQKTAALRDIDELVTVMRSASLCGLGQMAVSPATSALQDFRQAVGAPKGANT